MAGPTNPTAGGSGGGVDNGSPFTLDTRNSHLQPGPNPQAYRQHTRNWHLRDRHATTNNNNYFANNPDDMVEGEADNPAVGGAAVDEIMGDILHTNNDTAAGATAYTINTTWSMPRRAAYEPHLRSLMSFVHGRPEIDPYPKDTTFTRNQLLQLQPEHIRDWLGKKSFGKPNWSYEAGDRPTHYRSSSMEHSKKCVSFFMPHDSPWVNGAGNPTKSSIITDLIKYVKKLEVRGEGAESKAKRALSQVEFRGELRILPNHKDDLKHKVTYRTFGLLQYHTIGRVDDTAHFEMKDPRSHDKFSDAALRIKVTWSKNVNDERECPDQILFGSGDDEYCLLIALILHFETFLEVNPEAKYMFTKADDDEAPNRLKTNYRTVLKKAVWDKQEFKDLSEDGEEGDIGTHSKRKLPATYAIICGMVTEQVEIRGRWKGARGNKIVNRYIDTKQLYQDAKVAEVLCIGGAIMYEIVEELMDTITDDWLLLNVVPHTRRRFSNDKNLCLVLAKALLYICLKEVQEGDAAVVPVPVILRNRVRSAYALLGLDEQHPVKKVPLHIHRVGESLVINKITNDNSIGAMINNGTTAGVAAVGGGSISNEILQTLVIRMQNCEQAVQQQATSLHSAITEQHNFNARQFRILNNNVRCITGTIQGGFHYQNRNNQQLTFVNTNGDADAVVEDTRATLTPNLRCLKSLWNEYQFGLQGRKAARMFTTAERNKNRVTKQTYYRRNIIWDVMSKQMRRGLTIDQSVTEIHSVYGTRSSISTISKQIAKDRRTYAHNDGYHPNLSV